MVFLFLHSGYFSKKVFQVPVIGQNVANYIYLRLYESHGVTRTNKDDDDDRFPKFYCVLGLLNSRLDYDR